MARTLRPVLRPLRWGVGTGLAASVPILVALLLATPAPSGALWALGIAGGVVAAAVGAAQAVAGDRANREQREVSARLDEEVKRLKINNTELLAEKDKLEAARAQTNLALGRAGAFLVQILVEHSEDALNRLLSFLLEALHASLSSRGALCVTFMQYHGGPQFGLPEPRILNGSEVIYSVRAQVGPEALITHWQIYRGSEDERVAQRVFAAEPPWRRGVVISDLTDSDWASHAVLRMPNSNGKVKSYCRVPLLLGGHPLGLLCVDAVSPKVVVQGEYDVLYEPFATILASGFGVYLKGPVGSLSTAPDSHKSVKGPGHSEKNGS